MGILSGLDDIQQQLDDHILKSQTMRGSPYVKAFEADMVAWEEKLISMQDILDQWLQVWYFCEYEDLNLLPVVWRKYEDKKLY